MCRHKIWSNFSIKDEGAKSSQRCTCCTHLWSGTEAHSNTTRNIPLGYWRSLPQSQRSNGPLLVFPGSLGALQITYGCEKQ